MNKHIRIITGSLLLAYTLLTYSGKPASAASPAQSRQNDCLSVTGRRNLVENFGFESGGKRPDNWMFVVPGSERSRAWQLEVVKGKSMVHGGDAAVRLGQVFNGVNSASSWLDRAIVESRRFRLIPGNKYYLLFLWAKTDHVEDGHASVRIKYYDPAGKLLETRGHRWDTFYLDSHGRKGWHRYAYLVHPPDYNSDRHGKPSVATMASVSLSIDSSSGSVTFDDIGFVPVSADEYAAHVPGRNYMAPEIKAKTGPQEPQNSSLSQILVQKRNGVWWFVSPRSELFWSAGLVFSTNRNILEKTGLSRRDYIKNASIKAGEELFFNQGVRSRDTHSLRHYIEWLNFASEAEIEAPPEKWVAKDRNGNLIDGYTHYFPDVFSPVWQQHAVREAEKLLAGDGWLLESDEVIGYWTDNEWAYGDLYDFIWGDTAQYAFLDWLQGRNDLPLVDEIYRAVGSRINLDIPAGFENRSPYRSINELNSAWSSSYHRYRYRSFADIIKQKDILARAHDDPVLDDLRPFVRLMYKLYVDTVVGNIRKVESAFSARIGREVSHLVFSNRFSIETPAALTELRRNMDLFDRFDVIAVNLYPGYNNAAMYYPRSLLDQIKQTFHDTTGKPLYISEFGVAAEDASNCGTGTCPAVRRWRPQTVDTQENRGRAYTNIVSTLSQLPWLVGANWFKWTNGYGGPEGDDPRNCGLVDDNDDYYAPLVQSIKATNARLAGMERSPAFSLDDIDWSKTELTVCEP